MVSTRLHPERCNRRAVAWTETLNTELEILRGIAARGRSKCPRPREVPTARASARRRTGRRLTDRALRGSRRRRPALKLCALSFAISESAPSSRVGCLAHRHRFRGGIQVAAPPRSCVVEPARNASSPGGPGEAGIEPRRRCSRPSHQSVSSEPYLRRQGGMMGIPGDVAIKTRASGDSWRIPLIPVDETAAAWGSRYPSCLLRSQYVASARCRAMAPMALGWPVRRAMRSERRLTWRCGWRRRIRQIAFAASMNAHLR